MADLRYLKKRRQGWYLTLAVPRPLRPKYGRAKVVQSLKTQDLALAQKRRWPAKAEFDKAFDRLATGEPLSKAEIGEAAEQVYDATLRHLEAFPVSGTPEDDSETAEQAGLRAASWAIEGRIEAEEFDAAAGEIAPISKRLGVEIKPDSATYPALGMAILEAQHTALIGRLAALQGKPTVRPIFYVDPTTLQPPKRAVARPGVGGKPFSEIAGMYLGERRASLSVRAIETAEQVYALFADHAKDPPLAAVSRAQASEFLDDVQKARGLSAKTLGLYASNLAMVWKWARRRGIYEGASPWTEQARPAAKRGTTGYVPFEIGELNRLFAAPPKEMRWLPLLGLYTGARLGELCQLRRDDVKETAGIWYFDIREDDGRTVKTAAAVRRVPVHSEIIRAGFLDYVKTRPGPLFGVTARDFSRHFGEYRKSLGVTRDRLACHSLRKNATTALDQAGVPQADVAALIGHARGFSFDVYSGGPGLARLEGIVEKITYPGLVLPR